MKSALQSQHENRGRWDDVRAEGSVLNECSVFGPLQLDRYSCVSNSVLHGFLGVGCFSYITRSTIGKYVSVGSRVSIGGFNHPLSWLSTSAFQWGGDPWDLMVDSSNIPAPSQAGVKIGNDVWIGDNASILQGVEIGDGAVIGAGSIVTKNIDPYSINVGNPSKQIGTRFSAEVIQRIQSVKWWDLDPKIFSDIPWNLPLAALDMIESLKRS